MLPHSLRPRVLKHKASKHQRKNSRAKDIRGSAHQALRPRTEAIREATIRINQRPGIIEISSRRAMAADRKVQDIRVRVIREEAAQGQALVIRVQAAQANQADTRDRDIRDPIIKVSGLLPVIADSPVLSHREAIHQAVIRGRAHLVIRVRRAVIRREALLRAVILSAR